MKPDVIYQQNHYGVYGSDDNGEEWADISKGLPSRFGFAIAIDYNNPKTVFVALEESGAIRLPVGDKFLVWTSKDEGGSWSVTGAGLPSRSYYTVYREGMSADRENPCGVYVGASTGQLFMISDGEEAWRMVADGLPPIYSVTTGRA